MLLRKQAPIEKIDPVELVEDGELSAQTVMKLVMQVGSILLSSGAETYRVEDTMNIILRFSGASEYEVTALGTSLIASVIMNEGDSAYTEVRRVKVRSLHLSRIAEVNQISRDLVSKKICFAEAAARMNRLSRPIYSGLEKNIAIIVMICSFALLLSGDLLAGLGAIPIALGIILVNAFVRFVRIEGFVANVLSSFIGAAIAVITLRYFLPAVSLDIIIAGALMPLLPGTSFTNAIRDVIHGDYISAAARALEATFTAMGLALGVALALALFNAYL